jgi:hypothetical protein
MPPECVKDTDCPVNYTCTNNKCVALPPGQQPPPPVQPPQPGKTGFACEDNGNCDFNMYCGDNKTCLPVVGKCGYALNHAWVSYECCEDSDCPALQTCDNHICRSLVFGLTGNNTGFVGENSTVTAYSEGRAFVNSTLRITQPDGASEIVQTDSQGNALFSLDQAGEYTIELLVNGTATKTFRITSFGRGVSPPVIRTPTVFESITQAGGSLILLVILAVVAFLVYRFYFAGRGRKDVDEKISVEAKAKKKK